MKMLGFVVAACGLVLGAGVVVGQGSASGPAKRPITFADLMGLKRVSDPQISPSGRWVMFSVTDVSLDKNTKVNHLWVVPMNPTHDDKTVMNGAPGMNPTHDDETVMNGAPGGTQNDARGGELQVTFGEGETNGRFSPDGKWVSLSMKDQIYLAPWDEAKGAVGMPVQLTHVSGGGDGAIWSPDSRKLMFVAGVYPGCSVAGHADPTHDGEAVMNGAPTTWAEEDGCDKARDEAAEKSAVKGQVWDALLYRHWDHYLGTKRSHVLVVDLNARLGATPGLGENVRDLTPAGAVGDAETPTFSLGGPLGYAWAPDSKEIAYVTNLDKVPAASTNNDVFTLRLDEAGAKAVKVSTSPGSDDGPAYSPDGKWLAFRSQARNGFESDKFRITMYDRKAQTLHNLDLDMKDYSKPGRPVETDLDRWVDEFIWSDDSQRIFFAAGDKGEEVIYGTNFTGDDLHRFGKTAGEWGSLVQVPGKYELVASVMRVDRPSEIAVADLMKMDDSARTFVVALDGSAPTKNTTQAVEPLHLLTDLNDSLLSQVNLAPLESFWFTGAEGTKVQGFILRPPGFDPGKKYPVKFLMHGGPQTAWGDAWSFRWNWQLMAANGYVVVGINRRGSTGYGQKFVDEVSGDWGGRAYVDLMKGLDYAEGHYPFIDKTRECALGASYGGFMADWVLTHTNRFNCIVTHDGLYDPASAYGDTEEMWFNEWEFRRARDFPKGWDGFSVGYDPRGHPTDPTHRDKAAMNGAPGLGFADPTHAQTARVNGAPGLGFADPTHRDKTAMNGAPAAEGRAAMPWRYQNLPADKDPFRKWSPMLHIQDAKTPTLVIHSQKDYRLDVSQGIALFTALQRLHVPSKMLYFPDEGHWVLKPQNSQMWNEVVSDWCDRWTKTGKYAQGIR